MSVFNPVFNVNNKGFGPDITDASTLSSGLWELQKYPFEPSLKPEPLGKVCDFTFATYQRQLRDNARWGGGNAALANEEELRFHSVDTKPVKNKLQWNRRKTQKENTEAFNQKEQQEMALQLGKKTRSVMKKQQAALKAKQQRSNARYRTFAEWSVEPTSEWTVINEIQFSQLFYQKVDTSAIKAEDVCWRGTLNYYNKQADRISPKSLTPLAQVDADKDFYWVTTKSDSIIKDIILDPESTVQVAATAQILACLMSATQSRYSWHLIITKMEGKIIFDKTDGSIVDYLTVNETAPEPPAQDAENKLNRPLALGAEAVKINQSFSQHVLERNSVAENHEPAPFVEAQDNPAGGAYRYRIFTLPGRPNHPTKFGRMPVKIVTRGEVNAKLRNEKEGTYAALLTMNEYDLKSQKGWRPQIESQQGALLATEIRNNGNRLQRCVAAALIADCDTLKMGFVSRKAANDADNHVLLLVVSLKTKDLAEQIGLNLSNAWGIIRAVVDMLMEQPDGEYILLKDPTKPILRLYTQPEDDEEDGAAA